MQKAWVQIQIAVVRTDDEWVDIVKHKLYVEREREPHQRRSACACVCVCGKESRRERGVRSQT